MNILFISRKYPPIVGGMENYAYHLHSQFKLNQKVYSIILTKSQIHLIWFYPWIFIYGSYLVLTKNIKVVYVGDGVLSSVACFFQNILKKKVVITIYGLDVIFNKFYYQKMLKYFLPKIKNIVAISHATRNAALERGVSIEQCEIIPVGICIDSVPAIDLKDPRQILEKRFNINLQNKTILFTIGRLVKRKGVYWFVKNIINKLNNDYIYLIAGDGDEYKNIEDLIAKNNLQNKVFLLGKVSNDEKHMLFSACDAFISPNITIKNDMEGFGIVNLEAGLYGVPVIASNIEGVKDAIHNEITGFLVPEADNEAYINAMNKLELLNSNDIKNHVVSNFSWESIYLKYMKLFNEL